MLPLPSSTQEIKIEIASESEAQFLDLLAEIITNDIINETHDDE